MQPTILSVDQLEDLLMLAREDSANVVMVDWDNSVINVLGPERENPAVIMSDGKAMRSRPIILRIKGVPG